MRVRIEVTQEDIDKGKHGAMSCPVARATSRAFGYSVAVWGDYIDVRKTTSKTVFCAPGEVGRFIDAFDSGRTVKPFTFTIAGVPKEWVK